ncbi:MAG: hypothetical protein LBC75_10070 [Fibromonadaceae bacterium]|jgi:hypothetical protein|nr:hypothetical protein [Fibromonadaceae bacterium]
MLKLLIFDLERFLPNGKNMALFGTYEAIKGRLEKPFLELAPQALPKIVLLPKVIFECKYRKFFPSGEFFVDSDLTPTAIFIAFQSAVMHGLPSIFAVFMPHLQALFRLCV